MLPYSVAMVKTWAIYHSPWCPQYCYSALLLLRLSVALFEESYFIPGDNIIGTLYLVSLWLGHKKKKKKNTPSKFKAAKSYLRLMNQCPDIYVRAVRRVNIGGVMSQLSFAAEVGWLVELTATIGSNSTIMSMTEEADMTHVKDEVFPRSVRMHANLIRSHCSSPQMPLFFGFFFVSLNTATHESGRNRCTKWPTQCTENMTRNTRVVHAVRAS